MRKALVVVAFSLLVLGFQIAVHAQSTRFTFTTIDVPGSARTGDLGINGDGQIVGHFFDGTGHCHGFLRSADGSSLTTIDVPGATNTFARGINGSGQISGFFRTGIAAGVGVHGFLRSPDSSSFTTIDVPGAILSRAFGINDDGQIVGVFVNSTGLPPGCSPPFTSPPCVAHGFLRRADGSSFTTIDVPGAMSTVAYGINEDGQIVGFFDNSTGSHGFLRSADGRCFMTIDVPGARSTRAIGINDDGQVTGDFLDSTFVGHGFLATPTEPEKRKRNKSDRGGIAERAEHNAECF